MIEKNCTEGRNVAATMAQPDSGKTVAQPELTSWTPVAIGPASNKRAGSDDERWRGRLGRRRLPRRRRPSARVSRQDIAMSERLIERKSVLVTGGAGFLGSHL